MAKKTVATLQTGKEGRSYTKVIKMVNRIIVDLNVNYML